MRKASFDPEFVKTLQDTAGADVDVSTWPTNIHEYHKMMATAQAQVMELEKLTKIKPEVKPVEMGENKLEQE